MPKDILGGGLVDFEFEISQFALMQVFVSYSTKSSPEVSLGISRNGNRIFNSEERT